MKETEGQEGGHSACGRTASERWRRGSEIGFLRASAREEPLFKSAVAPAGTPAYAEQGKHERFPPPFLPHTLRGFLGLYVNLLWNLPGLTPKDLRTPRASAEKCTRFWVVVFAVAHQMWLFTSQIMLMFFSLYLFVLNWDTIPGFYTKGIQSNFHSVQVDKYILDFLCYQVDLEPEGGWEVGIYWVIVILWNGNHWPHFTDEKIEFGKFKLLAQGHTMPKQTEFRARKPQARSDSQFNIFSTASCCLRILQ